MPQSGQFFSGTILCAGTSVVLWRQSKGWTSCAGEVDQPPRGGGHQDTGHLAQQGVDARHLVCRGLHWQLLLHWRKTCLPGPFFLYQHNEMTGLHNVKKWMKFRKKSKWMLTPSPCRKICCELFVNIRSSANSWRNFYGWEMTSSPPEYSGNSSSFWEQRLSWGHPFKCWTIRWQLVGRWEPQQNSADRIHNSGEVIQKGDKYRTFWFAEFLDHSACFREIALSPSACSIHYSAIMAEAATNTTVQEDTVTNLCW